MIIVTITSLEILYTIEMFKPVIDHPDVILSSATLVHIIVSAIVTQVMEYISPDHKIMTQVLHQVFTLTLFITHFIVFKDDVVNIPTAPSGTNLISPQRTVISNPVASDQVVCTMDEHAANRGMVNIIIKYPVIIAIYPKAAPGQL